MIPDHCHATASKVVEQKFAQLEPGRGTLGTFCDHLEGCTRPYLPNLSKSYMKPGSRLPKHNLIALQEGSYIIPQNPPSRSLDHGSYAARARLPIQFLAMRLPRMRDSRPSDLNADWNGTKTLFC